MLIISLVLFEVLIFVTFILIFRRVMTKNVTSAARHIEDLSQDYTKKQEEAAFRLEEAKQKAEEIIAKAEEATEASRVKTIKEIEAERERVIQEARTQSSEIIRQAERSRQFLVSEIEERIAKEAEARACELMHDVLPEAFRVSAHNHWIEELFESGFSKLTHLRLPQECRQIKVTSAFSLSDAQRKNLAKKLNEALGFEIDIKEERDEKLVAGIIITVGSLVLDGSLKNKIKSGAKSA